MSWVYGFQCGEFIKIGVAGNIPARLKTLNLYNPYPCKVVLRRREPDAFWIEGIMHQLLAGHAVGREWFRITPEIARGIFEIALKAAKERRQEQIRWEIESSARVEARNRGRGVDGMGANV